MRTIKIDAPVEYCTGHLRYGSYIGIINLSEEEYKHFVENPIKTLYALDFLQDLSFEVKDYEVDDIGEIVDVNWSEV